MVLRSVSTRYEACQHWQKKKRPRRDGKKVIIGERDLPPPGPASESIAEVLDLGHYGHTSIFISNEQGWHFAKSVSYDAMMERRLQKKREREEARHIHDPGRKPNTWWIDDSKRRGRLERERRREERQRSMRYGRSHSDDEDDVDHTHEHRERKSKSVAEIKKKHVQAESKTYEEQLDEVDRILGFSPAQLEAKAKAEAEAAEAAAAAAYLAANPYVMPKVRDPGMKGGPITYRHNIKGEHLRAVKERNQAEFHLTDLIGFPLETKFACFYLGAGEPYIVVPQVLRELSIGYGLEWSRLQKLLNENGSQMMVAATGAQIRELKTHKIITKTLNATQHQIAERASIKLMRKSDACRLLGEYLPLHEDENHNIKLSRITAEMEEDALTVEHMCQGEVTGKMYSTGYVRCDVCKKIFKPDAFVCHSHERTETERVQHWGFNPRKWRDLINLRGKDRGKKEKIKRFNLIIAEPIPVEIRQTATAPGHSEPFLVPLNKNFNRRPPSPFTCGAEAFGRKPLPRRSDKDEVEEEEEEIPAAPSRITTVLDDEIQIIEPEPTSSSKVYPKEDFKILDPFPAPTKAKDEGLFKAPDLYATPLSRKYTDQLKNTKGFDLEGLLPFKLADQPYQKSLASLQSSFLHQQPTAVYRAELSPSSYFEPHKALFDLFKANGDKSKWDDEPLKAKQLSPPLTSTSKDLVLYQKGEQSLVPISASFASFPENPFEKYHLGLIQAAEREEMSSQLDQELRRLLQQVPEEVANQIQKVVDGRDKLREENFVQCHEELEASDNRNKALVARIQACSNESELLFRLCKEKEIPIPRMDQLQSQSGHMHMIPAIIPPVLPSFSTTTSAAALPPSSQPLALLAPSTCAPPTRPMQLNGGRSHSLSSPIGIRPVPASMLGQPGPAFTNGPVVAARPMHQPMSRPRGRPRGSVSNAGTRKNSMNANAAASVALAAQQAAQSADLHRKVEQQRQQQKLQHLRQLQHQQQQQQLQAFAASHAGLMNGSIPGQSSASNLLSYGLGTSATPASLANLFASPSSASQPIMQQQLHTPTPPDYTAQPDAAAIMARMQLDVAVSASSGMTTPSSSATPNGFHTPNGLQLSTPPTQDNVLSVMHLLPPEQIQQILMQNSTLEQLQQQQIQSVQNATVQPTPPPVAAPVVQIDGGMPQFDLNTFHTLLSSNPSLLQSGINLEDLLKGPYSALANPQ